METPKCIRCGKPIGKRSKYYCSKKCESEYKRNYETCAICGKRFPAPPSSKTLTCSKECDSIYRKINLANTSKKNLIRAHEEVIKSPNSGKFDTNVKAKTWILRDPKGKVYEANNLMNWCREQEGIAFEVDYMKFYRGIQGIKRTIQGKKKRGSYQYRGWTLDNFYEENLLIKDKDTTSQ